MYGLKSNIKAITMLIYLLLSRIFFYFAKIFFRPKVYDCFIFMNEIELLELRIEELKDTVDYFVICESEITFSGKKREEFIAEKFIKKLPKHIRKKIRYIKIFLNEYEKKSLCNPWEVEKFTRNNIKKGLFDVRSWDFIWLSDIDEIPNKEKVYKIGRLSMFFTYYKLNLIKPYKWTKAKGLIGLNLILLKPEFIRTNLWIGTKPIKNGGWHFSYLMSVEKISEKIKSFSHQEFNNKDLNNPKRIEFCIKNGLDLFSREGIQNTFNENGENLLKLKDLSFLPKTIKNNINNYKKWIS